MSRPCGFSADMGSRTDLVRGLTALRSLCASLRGSLWGCTEAALVLACLIGSAALLALSACWSVRVLEHALGGLLGGAMR